MAKINTLVLFVAINLLQAILAENITIKVLASLETLVILMYTYKVYKDNLEAERLFKEVETKLQARIEEQNRQLKEEKQEPGIKFFTSLKDFIEYTIEKEKEIAKERFNISDLEYEMLCKVQYRINALGPTQAEYVKAAITTYALQNNVSVAEAGLLYFEMFEELAKLKNQRS